MNNGQIFRQEKKKRKRTESYIRDNHQKLPHGFADILGVHGEQLPGWRIIGIATQALGCCDKAYTGRQHLFSGFQDRSHVLVGLHNTKITHFIDVYQ